MAYKCDSCGNTSEEQEDCCKAPMKDVGGEAENTDTSTSTE